MPLVIPNTDALIQTSDITTNNASTTKHGWRAKLTNVAKSYQDETGAVVATVVDTAKANTYSTGAQSFAAATSLLLPSSAAYAPTAVGSVGYDSTQGKTVAGGQGTISGGFPRVLYVTNSTTDTLTAATINTTETQFASTWQIPANYLIANKVLRITVLIQTLATATIPTSTMRIRLGAVGIGGVVVYLSSALALTASTFAQGAVFHLIGTAAAGASVNTITSLPAVVAGTGPFSKNTTAQPVLIATNAAQNINVTWQYSGNGASNTATLLSLIVEELN